MIDHRNRLCFVHIPKTAGRSVEIKLGHRTRRRDSTDPGWHAPASAYLPWLERGYRVFTIVRNPWDRLVSLNHFVTGEGQVIPMTVFLKWCTAMGWRPRRTEPVLMTPTQRGWIDLLTSTLRVLRFEQLDDEWSQLCREWSIRPSGELPRTNVAPVRLASYQEYYTDAEAERAAALCRWEIEQFGYEF